jgi:hypothetical protein
MMQGCSGKFNKPDDQQDTNHMEKSVSVLIVELAMAFFKRGTLWRCPFVVTKAERRLSVTHSGNMPQQRMLVTVRL